ncbi:MAG: hypothetical protein Kow0031_39330 [Anaerolineae bacterium]
MKQSFNHLPKFVLIAGVLALLAAWAVTQPVNSKSFTKPKSQAGQTWLIMMYQDADDATLEQDIFTDLNEAEFIGSSDQVHIVAQIDRYEGGFDGDGDWISTKRYYLTQDDDLGAVNSEEVMDLGEVNMADRDTLVDFVTWAAETYPADKHVLILSDHGMGWPGGWSDPDPGGIGRHDIPLAQFFEDNLYLMEIDEALGDAREAAGIDKFEIVGFDACLMGHLEVAAAIAPHANYMLSSQEVEPGIGWAYAAFLEQLTTNPEMDGAELATAIVDTYIDQDLRYVNDTARGEYILEAFEVTEPMTPEEAATIFSAEELAAEEGKGVTLAATDLSAIPDVMTALNNLVIAISLLDQGQVAQARSYAQSYTSVFGDDVPASYIDLVHFAMIAKEKSGDENVAAAADDLLAAMKTATIAEKHGTQKAGSNGLSIYFPNSELYGSWAAGYESYTSIANRFAVQSLWDDFLLTHYTGEALPEPDVLPTATPQPTATPRNPTATPTAVVVTVTPGVEVEATPTPRPTPTPSIDIVAPGAGTIEITELEPLADYASLDEPLLINTTIEGDNVAFVYFYAGYYDEENDVVWVADYDFVEADGVFEVDGVSFPDWGDEGIIEMEFEWSPEVYVISDGETEEFAVLNPEDYGATAEDSIYSVEGIYTSADGEDERYAIMYFDGNGLFVSLYGFTGEDGSGAPREITPRPGDQFTILLDYYIFPEDEEGDIEFDQDFGGTLTFGDKPLEWYAVPADAGYYEIGFIAEDYDGNTTEAYTEVEVIEVE